jgi:hypothetical protein
MKKAEITKSELVSMEGTTGKEVIEKIEEQDTSKLGLFFKNIVAAFNIEKLPKDTALELMRVEQTLQLPLSPMQVEGMRKRVEQVEKVCKVLGANNNLFKLKVQQLKEFIELKQKQWTLAIEASSAELVVIK